MTKPLSTKPDRPSHPLSPFRFDRPPSRWEAWTSVLIGGLFIFLLNRAVPDQIWIALTWTRAEGTITAATPRTPDWIEPQRSYWVEFEVTLPDGRLVSGRSATPMRRIRMLAAPYRTGADRMMPGQPPPVGARLDVQVSPQAPHRVMPVGEFAPGMQILVTPFALIIFLRGLYHLRRARREADDS